MLIFGHSLIKMQKFVKLKDDFDKTSVNCFDYNEKEIAKAKKLQIDFAVFAKNENEIILSNALSAKYILIDNEQLAIIASKLAEFYLFDTKILLLVDDLENLIHAYKLKVDGVCLKSYIR
ncbi:hypothetical protein I9T54_02330, partial [Campylobacter peloridis]|uniref:hypothetical protein n=1 Tax=Campylobacter peloridis TaxID=488546 RepID=UPI001C734897